MKYAVRIVARSRRHSCSSCLCHHCRGLFLLETVDAVACFEVSASCYPNQNTPRVPSPFCATGEDEGQQAVDAGAPFTVRKSEALCACASTNPRACMYMVRMLCSLSNLAPGPLKCASTPSAHRQYELTAPSPPPTVAGQGPGRPHPTPTQRWLLRRSRRGTAALAA